MGWNIFDAGSEWIAKKAFKDFVPAASGWTLRLFVNDIDPAASDAYTSANFTAPTGGGYADLTLDASDFTVAIVDGVATLTLSEQTFNFSGVIDGGNYIRGFILLDKDTSPTCIMGDRSTQDWAPTSSGGAYAVGGTYTLTKKVV